jgi:hypothetical protein
VFPNGRRTGVTSAALIIGLLMLSAADAPAQSLFGSIFESLGIRQQRPAEPAPQAYAPSQPGLDERYPAPDAPRYDRPAADAGIGGGSATHCIRLCDGRHFPVPRSASAVTPAKMCSALCPAAQTKVFFGSDPMRSAAADGSRYEDLPNASVYRERIVPDCSCTGKGPGGLAQIDIESDPTLRSGDVVATATGLAAFSGTGAYPYRKADFTPIDTTRMNGDLKRKLSELKVDENARSAVPVQSLATAEEPAQAKPKPQRRARVASENAPVPASRQDPPWGSWFR